MQDFSSPLPYLDGKRAGKLVFCSHKGQPCFGNQSGRKGVFSVIPCQKSCSAYCEGCHKSCTQWRAFQTRLREERQAKKDYLKYYNELLDSIHNIKSADSINVVLYRKQLAAVQDTAERDRAITAALALALLLLVCCIAISS